MTKSELIEAIARKQKHLPAKDVELAVKHLLDLMSDSLANGQRIEIRGFGSFSLHYRPPRIGRNPKTGEAVALSGKYVPHFKPGKDLRERVGCESALSHQELTILKRIGLVVLIVLIFAAMVAFTAGNPDEVTLKLLHWEINAPISVSFATAFAIGWGFGVLCMGLYAFRVANERRHLRRSLRLSENEVSSLRSLPLDDAD